MSTSSRIRGLNRNGAETRQGKVPGLSVMVRDLDSLESVRSLTALLAK
jgi:hypothetical protein